MNEIDVFATTLIEEAKRFLEKANESEAPEIYGPYLHASLLLGFAALEAHVAAIGDDFVSRPELTAHEKGLLLEREVRLKDGSFVLTETLKMSRLEDRIEFIHHRFSASRLDRSAAWWSDLKNALKLRNELTHPREAPAIKKSDVSRALQSIIDTLNELFLAVFKTKFPPANRGLTSKMTF